MQEYLHKWLTMTLQAIQWEIDEINYDMYREAQAAHDEYEPVHRTSFIMHIQAIEYEVLPQRGGGVFASPRTLVWIRRDNKDMLIGA